MTGTPYIPETITVHLGPPDSDAQNVTVPFADYIKNVASSEIYPTWPENAIRANIYAQISYALNRIYTEWYRSRGYDFDITSSTAYDQSYNYGKDIFENIGQITDDIFNSYISRQGNVEPLFAQFCDGINVVCDGLSQWGTVDLANQGYTPYEILQYYYGDDIDIVMNAPIQNIEESYPGRPLQLGDINDDVKFMQTRLNRISKNYPLIPKIDNVNGVFGRDTQDAVKAFQETFNLTVDGIVGKATWYKILYIYSSVKNLAELDSEGLALSEIARQFGEEFRAGDVSYEINVIRYYINTVASFNPKIPSVPYGSGFDAELENSIRSFQQEYGLPVTGIVDEETWNKLEGVYIGIIDNTGGYLEGLGVLLYPGEPVRYGTRSEAVRALQTYLSYIADFYPSIPKVSVTGYYGDETQSAINAFKREFGLEGGGIGFVGGNTWNRIAEVYLDLREGDTKSEGQNPGYTLGE